jgi:superfamily I DNA and/or RNA helicase
MPVRDFVRNAADVLLALKPCWAMSPLIVSQLLPPKAYFDVVIFDEASQITPADAVSSIVKAGRNRTPVAPVEFGPRLVSGHRP